MKEATLPRKAALSLTQAEAASVISFSCSARKIKRSVSGICALQLPESTFKAKRPTLFFDGECNPCH